MLSRHLTGKVEVITNDESVAVPKNIIELEYYLLESDHNEVHQDEAKKIYGIEIVKKEGILNVERETILDFSCCMESTRSLLNTLANNTVTPIALPFILDDMIGV